MEFNLPLDDRKRVTYRMNIHTTFICSKVGRSGCPIRFKLESGSALLLC